MAQIHNFFPDSPRDVSETIDRISLRYNREYEGKKFDLPEEVQAMPIFHEWVSGKLPAKIASPFWMLAEPQKNQQCLDIGCGVSFLIYPWSSWGAFFHGQEISSIARDALKSRAPQLNSKLFKGVELGAAHELNYPENQFDLAIATGFSCYYSLDYWTQVLTQVKRVLKPSGQFIFDAIDPDSELAEDWAILETYLGSEVFLEPLSAWDKLLSTFGVKKITRLPGSLFTLYKVSF
jgi:SAM-dependent methyltransferase